jgi:hypothetical protein
MSSKFFERFWNFKKPSILVFQKNYTKTTSSFFSGEEEKNQNKKNSVLVISKPSKNLQIS